VVIVEAVLPEQREQLVPMVLRELVVLQELVEQQELRELVVLQELVEQQDHQELAVHQELVEQQELQELVVLQELVEQQELLELVVLQELVEQQEKEEQQGQPVIMGLAPVKSIILTTQFHKHLRHISKSKSYHQEQLNKVY
jgi:hypothetical protein